MGDNGALAAFLAAHDGVITTDQARDCGLTQHEIHGRVHRGDWLAFARAVFHSASHEFTEQAMVRAVVLAHRGVADSITAAWWHGMITTLPAPITLSCRYTPRERPWQIEIRTARRTLLPDSITEVRGLAVTRRPLTVLMACSELSNASAFLDRVLQTGEVELPQLQRALERHAGLRGIVEARRLVAVASTGGESEAERLFMALLKERQITGWVVQFRLGRYRFDFAWPDHRLVVEISGWTFHRTQSRRSNDMRKANFLEEIKWRQLEFDWHMLDGEPGDCIQQVIDMLNAAIPEAL